MCSDLIRLTLHRCVITATLSHIPSGHELQEAGLHSLPTETVAGGVKNKTKNKKQWDLKAFMHLHEEIVIFF